MALRVSAGDAQASSLPTPELPPFSAQTRLLVIAPHPDDETIANGVLIQRVRAAGGAVKIVLLTAGENNPWPQRWLERRLRIEAVDRRRWGQRRHIELGQALQQLDVGTDALQTLVWPDLGVTDVLLHSCAPAVDEMAAAIQAFGPDIVAMPSLEDRHPDHGSAHVLTRLALAQGTHAPMQLAYLIHGRAAQAPVIDVAATAEQSLNKQQALDAHRSQMALSAGRMRRLAGRPERYTPVAPRLAAPTSNPALPWHPPAWLRPLLQLSVVDGSTVQTWPWSQAPLRRDGEGRYRLALPSLWIFDHWGWCEL
jgi:N-acetyl-1-D-myo-inositol-2-amino-2-deoxy-alpha-D-glucopyranoside deacetylase